MDDTVEGLREAWDSVEEERARAELVSAMFGTETPAPELARYQLGERLGQGGNGVVYRAFDPHLERAVAVKLVIPAGAGSKKEVSRIESEAKALARLSDEHVLPIYDVGRFTTPRGRGVFLVTELIEGATLDQWISKRQPDAAEIVRVMLDAAAGLAAAHTVGLVHRDFKPANLMLGDDGRVRVLDFGLARPAGVLPPSVESDEDSSVDSLDERLTETGLVVGTPAYMAPEQVDGRDVDARGDQYSYCVTLYEALEGKRPFRSTMKRSPDAPVPPMSNPAVPRRVQAAILRGLSFDPARRFESMDALIGALRPRARRRRWTLAAGLVAVGAAIAIPWGGANDEESAVAADAPLSLDVAASRIVQPTLQAQQILTLHESGKDAEAVARADELLARARREGDPNLELNVLDMLARVQRKTQTYKEIRATYLEAYEVATEHGFSEEAAKSAMNVAQMTTLTRPLDVESVEKWLRHAEAACSPRCRAPLQAQIHVERARLASERGQFAEEERHSREALALYETLDDPDPQLEGLIRSILSTSLGAQGRIDEALEQSHKTAEAFAAAYGPDHHNVTGTRMNIAFFLLEQGKIDEARDILAPLCARLDTTDQLDPAATCYVMLADVESDADDTDRAVELARRALEITQENFGKTRIDPAQARYHLAGALQDDERFDEAIVEYQRAVADFEAKFGPSDRRHIRAILALGNTQRQNGETAKARQTLRRALRWMGDDPQDPMQRVFARIGLAKASADEAAVELFEQALTDPAFDSFTPAFRAGYRFDYAKRLEATGRVADAVAQAELAAKLIESQTLGPRDERTLREPLRHWLRQHDR